MKSILKIIQLIIFIFLSACVPHEDISQLYEKQQVYFSSNTSIYNLSRGTPISSANSVSEFVVYAYYTGNGDENTWTIKKDSAVPNFMYEQVVTNSGYNTGTNSWEYSPTVYWPSYSNANVTFFAYAPKASSTNGISITETKGGLSISYVTPTSCSDQPDLMISTPAVDINGSTSDAVPINMKHTLTSIGFKAVGSNDYITSIVMENIISSGQMSYDIANDSIVWELDDVSSETYSAITNDSLLNTNYQSVITSGGYLMFPPQTTGENALLTLTSYSGLNKSYNLSNATWKAGESLNYYIDLTSALSDLTIDVITNGFVSAYWRYNETGERIIRMNNNGDWEASLYAIDDSWPSTDILLDYLPSSYNSTPGSLINGSIAQMTTYENTLTGSGDIAFRIGLDANATLASSESAPRYAVVLVKYDDLTKNHLIFLRQGESPVKIGTSMFATYNISYTESSTTGIYEFVDYPSVGGGKKQWSPDAIMYESTSSSSTSSVDIDTIANICPTGYEIPSYSDLYYAVEDNYCIGGLIADGYFDRLLLMSVTQLGVGPYYIGGSSPSVAYGGGLIYNINTYASIFFPYAGYLPIGSSSVYTGQRGYYWATTTENEYAIAMTMQFENADTITNKITVSPGQWNEPYYGMSIRPVLSE